MSKLEKYVGNIVVRTKPLKLGEGRQDRSYMSKPIQIEAVVRGVVYYRGRPRGDVRILSADYDDGNWETVCADFIHDTWGWRV